MQELRRIEQDILLRGKIDGVHLAALRLKLYSGASVGLLALNFLVELHKKVLSPNPAFERLYYRAIRDRVLIDGRIEAEQAAWLRSVLFADGVIKDEERKFLKELKQDVLTACPEFEAMFAEATAMPSELVVRERREAAGIGFALVE